MILWFCGFIVLWFCGFMVFWMSGFMAYGFRLRYLFNNAAGPWERPVNGIPSPCMMTPTLSQVAPGASHDQDEEHF